MGFSEITHMGSLNPPKLSVVYWHGNHQLSQPISLLALIHAHTTSVSFWGWHRARHLILVFIIFLFLFLLSFVPELAYQYTVLLSNFDQHIFLNCRSQSCKSLTCQKPSESGKPVNLLQSQLKGTFRAWIAVRQGVKVTELAD